MDAYNAGLVVCLIDEDFKCGQEKILSQADITMHDVNTAFGTNFYGKFSGPNRNIVGCKRYQAQVRINSATVNHGYYTEPFWANIASYVLNKSYSAQNPKKVVNNTVEVQALYANAIARKAWDDVKVAQKVAMETEQHAKKLTQDAYAETQKLQSKNET